ncbi:MAG TPA: hypothetical protein VGB51_06570 [Actinomycetota bacterium]
MKRYLVVANQTLGGDHLAEAVRERAAAGPSEFHVVVPATPPPDHATYTEGEAEAVSRERLDKGMARLAETGAAVTGEVGDADPMLAIRDALLAGSFDEILLSTLPAGASRWLKLDLPHRVDKAVDIPVVHLEAQAEEG